MSRATGVRYVTVYYYVAAVALGSERLHAVLKKGDYVECNQSNRSTTLTSKSQFSPSHSIPCPAGGERTGVDLSGSPHAAAPVPTPKPAVCRS